MKSYLLEHASSIWMCVYVSFLYLSTAQVKRLRRRISIAAPPHILAPIHLTYNGNSIPARCPSDQIHKEWKARKPYVMTQARKEAFEKCNLARLAKQTAPVAASTESVLARVQLAKDQAKRIDSTMGITEEIEAVLVSSPPVPATPVRCRTG
jgi:hypothetical protein